MKISHLSIYKVDIELEGELHSTHTKYSVTSDVFVKLETDTGAFGYGSTAPKTYITGETQDSAIAVLQSKLAPAVLGLNPFDLERLHDVMDHAIKFNSAAKAAIDVAVHDLLGRSLGVPVYKLLGGAFRLDVPAFDLIGLMPPEEAAQRAKNQLAKGYDEFKVKVGHNHQTDLERIRAVSDVIAGRSLKVDANQAWNRKQAVQYIKRFQDVGVTVVEQPVHMDDVDGLRQIREQCTGVEIVADESVKSLEDALLLSATHAVDILNVKLVKTGGLHKAKKMAAIAEAAHVGCMAGCTIQNTLLDAATAHFLASTSNIVYNEIKAPLWTRNDVASGLEIRDGRVLVPQGAGLGIDIDVDRLEEFRVK